MASFGLLTTACQPESVRQEKALRRQLIHEMRNHSYVAAAPIARQLLQRKPHDERLWKQLMQAQMGLHDLDGAKDTLQRWRTEILAHHHTAASNGPAHATGAYLAIPCVVASAR